jgi:hypothetical protein
VEAIGKAESVKQRISIKIPNYTAIGEKKFLRGINGLVENVDIEAE